MQDLGTRWVLLFEKCIKERDFKTARTLFHDEVIYMGMSDPSVIHKADELAQRDWQDDWFGRVQFNFDIKNSQIAPFGNTCLICVSFENHSRIHGAPKQFGNCTFFLVLFREHLLCIHAHLTETSRIFA